MSPRKNHINNRNDISDAKRLLQDINLVPKDKTVSLLIRHAARKPITNPDMAFVVDLTVKGLRDSQVFGEALAGEFNPGAIYSSPVGRCIQTAEGIILGAKWQREVMIDERLTHPYIRSAMHAISISSNSLGLPNQIIRLFSLLCGSKGELIKNRLNLFSTHDTVIGTMLGYLLADPGAIRDLPEFLEGFFLWREGNFYHLLWRGKIYKLSLSKVLGL